VIPADVLAQPRVPEEEAHRRLLRIAAEALGVATEADLRDYFRLPTSEARAEIANLVERGDLVRLAVESWKQPAYALPGLKIPRNLETSALLSPFDPVVWNRARAQRLFDFEYRIEIYTPSHKRVHGYYVLPYLLNDRLVARVDLKADRAAGTLRVHAAHFEPHVRERDVAPHLRRDLRRMASWLGLERVATNAGRPLTSEFSR
jgi:hypothetical protein